MKKLALIGFGKIAPKHLAAFRSLGAEFVASCNRSESGRRRASDEGLIANTYDSIPKMLEQESPDGVICCASVDQMAAAATQVIEAKVPVLIEKPAGLSLTEIDALTEASRAHGSPVMVGLNRRSYSVVNKAVEEAGGFDAITSVSVVWSEEPDHLRKRVDDSLIRKWIFANSIHGLDLLVYLAGAVTDVDYRVQDRGDLRWSMAFQGESARGALVTFRSSWDAPARWSVTFTAKGRQYTFAPLETCRVLEAGSRQERIIEPDEDDQKLKPGFLRQSQAFLQMLETGEVPPTLGLDAARPAMVLAEALTSRLDRRG